MFTLIEQKLRENVDQPSLLLEKPKTITKFPAPERWLKRAQVLLYQYMPFIPTVIITKIQINSIPADFEVKKKVNAIQ